MKTILYIVLVCSAEIWLTSMLNEVIGFTRLIELYLATTVLGAIILFIRYPAFRTAKKTSKEVYTKLHATQDDPDGVMSEVSSDSFDSFIFIWIYILAIILTVIPGVITDSLGILLLMPAISHHYIKKYSRPDLGKLLPHFEKLENHPETQVRTDSFFWFRLFLIALLFTGFIWLWGKNGGIAAIFASIAVTIVVSELRRFYCSFFIYPNGINDYNKAQEYVRKFRKEGSPFHKVMREFWMRKLFYFLYNTETMRWAWRPYVLGIVLVVVFYWSPLIGSTVLALFFSMVIKTMNKTSVPTALYLGSSFPESHELLRNLQLASAIQWVSLLDDGIIADVPENTGLKGEHYAKIIELMSKTNLWSLRMSETADWQSVVADLILASAVIVIRPENDGPVRYELELLAKAEYQERIIVIRTETLDESKLPSGLQKCVLEEREAMEMIKLIYTQPKKFRAHMQSRFISR